MSEESAWTKVEQATDLLRDVLRDLAPELEGDGRNCECPAHRAWRFVAEEDAMWEVAQ